MRVLNMAMAAFLSLSLAPVPSRAQYLAPVAVRPLAAAPTTSAGAVPATTRDTLAEARREISPVGTIVGGVVGGVVGSLIGLAIASRTHMSCQGDDFCGLGEGLVGFSLGEPIGLAVGAHLGSRSTHPENIYKTSLASAGILVGGVLTAVGLSQVGGAAIMVPLTPAFQLAAALAIESH
jgi:hypothetical protein